MSSLGSTISPGSRLSSHPELPHHGLCRRRVCSRAAGACWRRWAGRGWCWRYYQRCCPPPGWECPWWWQSLYVIPRRRRWEMRPFSTFKCVDLTIELINSGFLSWKYRMKITSCTFIPVRKVARMLEIRIITNSQTLLGRLLTEYQKRCLIEIHIFSNLVKI